MLVASKPFEEVIAAPVVVAIVTLLAIHKLWT
jgi:hypothetical protein